MNYFTKRSVAEKIDENEVVQKSFQENLEVSEDSLEGMIKEKIEEKVIKVIIEKVKQHVVT